MTAGLILIGGGGHCRSCIDVIEAEGRLAISGILDVREKIGTQVCGYPVVGTDDMLPALVETGHRFLITLGQIRSAAPRIDLFGKLRRLKAILAIVASPTAYVSKRAVLGEGTIVMHHAVVNAGSKIGSNCILNTQSLIEHDAEVGDHCHVSTAAVLNGGARLGDRSFLGSNAVVFQGVSIAGDCVIGAGSRVRKSLAEPGLYDGEPLRGRELR